MSDYSDEFLKDRDGSSLSCFVEQGYDTSNIEDNGAVVPRIMKGVKCLKLGGFSTDAVPLAKRFSLQIDRRLRC